LPFALRQIGYADSSVLGESDYEVKFVGSQSLALRRDWLKPRSTSPTKSGARSTWQRNATPAILLPRFSGVNTEVHCL
jgi:hypothetical protein